jgi:AbrB family looped-hinge helix DNA binding protein
LAERFQDGVHLAEMAKISEDELVGPTLAAALQIPFPDIEHGDRIGSVLSGRQLLLIVDNCEHLAGRGPVIGLAIRTKSDYLTFVLPNEAAMSAKHKPTTTVSTKGQVILPKAIRERLHWPAGTELVVEDTPEGVLLKAKPAFAPTRPKDVFGSLPYKGPAKSIADMEAGIAAEAKRRHARNRY